MKGAFRCVIFALLCEYGLCECSNDNPCPSGGFCNFDYGESGFCEPCSGCPTCFQCGLNEAGAQSCSKFCTEGCCAGSHTDFKSSNPFFPTDAVQCNNMGKNWVAACESGLSCLVLTCSGTLGTNTGMFYTKLVSSCTTAQLQTASIAEEETAMSQGGYTEVQCVAAFVTTHTCSKSSNSSGGNVLTSCSCNPGYTASDGGPCSPCPYGTYKDSIGQYSIVILCCLSLYLSYVTNGDL